MNNHDSLETPEVSVGNIFSTMISIAPNKIVIQTNMTRQNFYSSSRVTKSKNPDYAVGTEWVCFFGWRSHTVFNPSKQFDNLPKLSGSSVCIFFLFCGFCFFAQVYLYILPLFSFLLFMCTFSFYASIILHPVGTSIIFAFCQEIRKF